jgi:hypothetical protein
MTDKVRDDRRTRGTLGQTILVARDLGQYGRNLGMQHKVDILDEKAPDAAKIDRWKEILKINIEYVSPLLMLCSVRHDRSISLEPVRQLIFPFPALVDFFNAILEEIRQTSLQQHQLGRWGIYLADPAPTLRNIKRTVFGQQRLLVQDVGESLRLELEEASDVM